MKLKRLLALVLALSFSLSFANAAYAKNEEQDLSDYQLVIDELNQELGTHITIPDDERSISITLSMTPEALKESLREQYLDAIKKPRMVIIEAAQLQTTIIGDKEKSIQPADMYISPLADDISENSAVARGYITTTSHQEQELVNSEGRVFLDTYIRVDYDYSPTRYTYDSLIKLGSIEYLDVKTFFRANRPSTNTLNSDRTVCTVTYNGTMISKQGYDLLIARTYVVAYRL